MDSDKLSMIFFSITPIIYTLLGIIVYKLNINPSSMILFSILYLFVMYKIDIRLSK